MSKSRKQYPLRPRSEVLALCPDPVIPEIDCRNEPSRQGHGIYRSATFDALAVRSHKANLRRKAKEHGRLERSFRTTGMSQDNVRSGKVSR
jgi:hypothetical protein